MARLTTVVVGAGIVGVCVALWLQRKGQHVILLDRNEPGTGTSYGNACTIADYGCIPINHPSLFSSLPSRLLSRDSPLSVDLFHALRHPRWMVDFLRHCTPSQVDRIILALGALLSQAAAGLDPLIDDTGSQSLLPQRGFLNVYQTRQAYENNLASNRKRAEQGSVFDTLDNRQLHELEPALAMDCYRALWFPGVRHVSNPKSLVDRFVTHFQAHGGLFRQAGVFAVEPGCRVILDNAERIDANAVVICAGAFSRAIQGAGTHQLPLNVERGYHVQFADRSSLISRPVGWAEAGFYATPTSEGLRFAGTVEIASLDKPPSATRVAYITRKARQMFHLEEEPSQSWLGFRPTFPDALPVIGPSPVSPDICLAFGHQHLGLTLAGITGKLVAEWLVDHQPSLDLTPYRSQRFS